MKTNGRVYDLTGANAGHEPRPSDFTKIDEMSHEIDKLRYTIECLCMIVGALAKKMD